eukprot:gnl/TRDRNA2_/TRDRNA2_116662_c3_seq4.p1 gnl/TRDRNA2_/TRDRNA2_116662_c3~~gnl/TRDRNA2_/TRDRNA2_116662_c3_seq4.p1  ORF type:complete len:218 (+),score=14.12 gnl/TRDRNA2_/TRDRNA2_116662_c3_seq4:85-738(+)
MTCEYESNSLFFELFRHWGCLLIEPNQDLQELMLKKHRKCHVLLGGLSITDRIGSFKFLLDGAQSGILETLAPEAKSSWQSRTSANGSFSYRKWRERGNVVTVRCFPLHLVMQAVGRNVVDYWSLDTEGSEYQILIHTDFSKIEIGVMSVESLSEHARVRIRSFLRGKGFRLVLTGGLDDCFANVDYFRRRGLSIPTYSGSELLRGTLVTRPSMLGD